MVSHAYLMLSKLCLWNLSLMCLLDRFSQRGHVLIMPFVHAWAFCLKVLCSLIKLCLGVPYSLIKVICHLICFQTLKVKSLKLDKSSCFLCFTKLFISDIYLFKYFHWVNFLPYLMIIIFFLSVFETLFFTSIWQRMLHFPLPYFVH